MELSNLNINNGLCISLGANIDSKYGDPITSLIVSRPKIELIIKDWIDSRNFLKKGGRSIEINFSWSSLYKTHPQGISEIQPDYINTLLLAKSNFFPAPSLKEANYLLNKFKDLENEFGRKKFLTKRWLPRCLDIDIIWFDNLLINNTNITIPHPRFTNRNFVIAPLTEILSKSQKVERLNVNEWLVI